MSAVTSEASRALREFANAKANLSAARLTLTVTRERAEALRDQALQMERSAADDHTAAAVAYRDTAMTVASVVAPDSPAREADAFAEGLLAEEYLTLSQPERTP